MSAPAAPCSCRLLRDLGEPDSVTALSRRVDEGARGGARGAADTAALRRELERVPAGERVRLLLWHDTRSGAVQPVWSAPEIHAEDTVVSSDRLVVVGAQGEAPGEGIAERELVLVLDAGGGDGDGGGVQQDSGDMEAGAHTMQPAAATASTQVSQQASQQQAPHSEIVQTTPQTPPPLTPGQQLQIQLQQETPEAAALPCFTDALARARTEAVRAMCAMQRAGGRCAGRGGGGEEGSEAAEGLLFDDALLGGLLGVPAALPVKAPAATAAAETAAAETASPPPSAAPPLSKRELAAVAAERRMQTQRNATAPEPTASTGTAPPPPRTRLPLFSVGQFGDTLRRRGMAAAGGETSWSPQALCRARRAVLHAIGGGNVTNGVDAFGSLAALSTAHRDKGGESCASDVVAVPAGTQEVLCWSPERVALSLRGAGLPAALCAVAAREELNGLELVGLSLLTGLADDTDINSGDGGDDGGCGPETTRAPASLRSPAEWRALLGLGDCTTSVAATTSADVPTAVCCDADVAWLRLRAHASVLTRVAEWSEGRDTALLCDAFSGTAFHGAIGTEGATLEHLQQKKGAETMLPLSVAAPPFTSPLSSCLPFEPPSALRAEWALARRHPAVADALRAMRAEHAEWLRAQSRTLLRFSTAAAHIDANVGTSGESGSGSDLSPKAPGAEGFGDVRRAEMEDDARIAEDGDDECPVCMHRLLPASEELSAERDDLDGVSRPQDAQLVVTTTCGHRFHLACLRKSRKYNTGCPLCRAPIAQGLSPAQKTKRPLRASADNALQTSSLIGVTLSLDVPRNAVTSELRAATSGMLLRSMRRSSGWGAPPPRNAGRPTEDWG